MILLQKKMLDKGRRDFTNYLGEILSIAPGNASLKFRGKRIWTLEQIKLVAKELKLTTEDIEEIFDLRGFKDES